jgi:type III restriction enzyme
MAMLIAWQTINAKRHPGSPRFTRGFLVVTPGLTIRDRLRVLQPNDPDSYYQSRELVPNDMLEDIGYAKIIITNYHAFMRRERLELSKGSRSLLQGRGPALDTLESEGQMIQRVMPDLMGLKHIVVLNDEAHHCYREKVSFPPVCVHGLWRPHGRGVQSKLGSDACQGRCPKPLLEHMIDARLPRHAFSREK